jgi:predicted ATP-grasp superfamily ATP-dependent carboligase
VRSADVRQMPLGFRSRYARSHHVLDNSTPASYDAALVELVGSIRPDVFLPIGARSVAASVRQRHMLESVTSLSVPHAEALAAANDKSASMASCESLGIPCARVYLEADAMALMGDGSGISFVVKPETNVGAARGVHYVSDPRQMASALAECRKRFGRALIQEYVPGEVDAMKTAILLFSNDTQLIAAFTTRKQRQWPSTGGLSVVSRSTDDQAIVSQVLPFFEKWRWEGPAEVELKHDGRTGVDKVIEINPRFPAYLRFAQRCGLDLVALAARLAARATETPRPYPGYATGVTYLNPGLFIKSAASAIRQSGMSAVPRAAREFAAGFPCVLDMLQDPLPFLARAVEDLRGVRS